MASPLNALHMKTFALCKFKILKQVDVKERRQTDSGYRGTGYVGGRLIPTLLEMLSRFLPSF
jgi:hypothetical protein